MKAQDLLSSLDYISDDLLAGTESGLRVTKRRPWLGAAVAAALVLLLAAGGLTAYHLHRQRTNRPADQATDAVLMPDYTEPDPTAQTEQPTQPAPFAIGRDYLGAPLSDLDEIAPAGGARWTGLSEACDTLPVFRNRSIGQKSDGGPIFLRQQEMLARAEAIADFLGFRLCNVEYRKTYFAVDPTAEYDGTDPMLVEPDPEGYAPLLTAEFYVPEDPEASYGAVQPVTITVSWDGAIRLEERSPDRPDAAPGVRAEDVLSLFAQEYSQRRFAAGAEEYLIYDGEEARLTAVYPAQSDPKQAMLSCWLEQMLLMYRPQAAEESGTDHTELRLTEVQIREFQSAPKTPEEGCTVPGYCQMIGEYPIISAEEARRSVEEGVYLSMRDLAAIHAIPAASGETGEAPRLSDLEPELLYPSSVTRHQILLPFYCFWFEQEDGSLSAAYVPAVDPAYLTDYPEMPAPEEPGSPTETTLPVPGLEETEPASTEIVPPETEAPAVTEKPDEPALPDVPEVPDTTVPESQQLSLDDCFFGYHAPTPEYRYYRDVDREIVLSPWSDKDPETAQYLQDYPDGWLCAFPKGPMMLAYRNAAMPVPDGEAWAYQSQEYMEEEARQWIAARGGVIEDLSWGTSVAWEGEEPENKVAHDTAQAAYCDTLRVRFDGGELIWYGNGDHTCVYSAPLEIPGPPTDYEPFYPFPEEPLNEENRDAYLCAWVQSFSDGDSPISLIPVHAVRYDAAGNRAERVFLVVNEAYPHETALTFSLFCISLELDAQGRLLSYSVSSTDLSEWLAGNDVPQHSLTVESGIPKGTPDGYYPWIPKNEADANFRNGLYLTTASPAFFPEGKTDGDSLLAHAVHVEIVYKTDNAKLILPFYRYWVELNSSDLPEGLTRYGAFYVPAIPSRYLKEYPTVLMPGAPYASPYDNPIMVKLTEAEQPNSWFHRILAAGPFDSPEQIDLGNLFYARIPGVSVPMTAELWAEIRAAGGEDVDLTVLPGAEMDRILSKYLGITLNEIPESRKDGLTYLPEADCWYIAGDRAFTEIRVDGYEKLDDGTLVMWYGRLTYPADKEIVWAATLRLTEDGYQILSNRPANG